MPENRDSILSLIDIANTLPDVCSSPCIVELQSLIKQGSGGVTFSATSSVTSEVLVGNKVTYNRLTATSSEIKVSDATSQYDTTILTEEQKLKLSLGDESYAGITYSSIEARTADGGQTTEIYIKNHDNTYTYDKQITSQADNTDMTDGTSSANRYLSKDTFGVSVDNGTDMRSYIQGQVYPGSPNEGLLVISIDDGVYDQNYTNSISLVNNAGDGRISIYQKDETQPYSAKIEMKADTNTVEIKSENGTGTTPATDISDIVLTPNSITNTVTDGTFTSQNYIISDNILNEIVGEGNTASTFVATPGIVSSIVGGGNTSTQTIAPTNIVSLVTDGTYTSQNYINSNTITSTSTDGGSTSSITQTTNEIISSSTDGTNTSSIITETTVKIILSTDGGDISAGISVDVSGGGSIVLNMIDTTIGSSSIDIQPTGITTTSTSTTDISTITLANNNFNVGVSDIDGATSSFYFDANKEIVTIGIDNLSTGKTSILTLDPNNVGSADGSYLYTTDAIGTQSQIKFSLDGISNEYINGDNEATIRIQKDYIATQITDGTDTGGIALTTTSLGLLTPKTIYNAQSNGNLEISCEGDLIIMGDNQNNQTRIDILSNQLQIDIASAGILNIIGLPAFDDDVAAGTGGLVAGNVYQTTGSASSPLDVAGILMIKQ